MITLKKLVSVSFVFLLSVGAALGGIHVESSLSREFNLGPGEKAEGKIIIRNNGEFPEQVKVYLMDYLFYADGRNIYGEPGSTPRSNSSWITFSPREFVVPGGGTVSVHYTAQAPGDQTLCGSYWSMLMVEPIPQEALLPPKPEQDKPTVNIRTVLRYGIQIATQIRKSGRREIRFADSQLLPGDGRYVLQFDIENTGERWLKPAVVAEVYDDRGIHIGRFEGAPSRIYPGCSVRQKLDLGKLEAGKYSALVIADSGDESAWGQQYVLEIK